MFDEWLRGWKDRLLARPAAWLGGTSPVAVTVIGFLIGGCAVVALALGWRGVAVGCWLANRTLDGLDGTLARQRGRTSDFGAYLDIMLDFVIYAAIPIVLVLRDPVHARTVAALLLLATFYLNAASWMYLSAILERRGRGDSLTAVVMPPGLIGGTETVVFYTLFMLLPSLVTPLFLGMAALVLVNVIQRLVWSARRL
ncbi:MAG: CDP-alcohol phosphatidyltransferase family protein [Gemmatimonadota bacterium]